LKIFWRRFWSGVVTIDEVPLAQQTYDVRERRHVGQFYSAKQLEAVWLKKLYSLKPTYKRQ